jgi:hypothetical protein
MGYALLLELAHCFFELVVIAHIEAQVIQSDPVLIEAIVENRLGRVGRFGESQDGLAVGQQHAAGTQFHCFPETQQGGIEPNCARQVRDRQGDVVDGLGLDGGIHFSLLSPYLFIGRSTVDRSSVATPPFLKRFMARFLRRDMSDFQEICPTSIVKKWERRRILVMDSASVVGQPVQSRRLVPGS